MNSSIGRVKGRPYGHPSSSNRPYGFPVSSFRLALSHCRRWSHLIPPQVSIIHNHANEDYASIHYSAQASNVAGSIANHQAHLWFACTPGCGCRYRGTLHDTSQCRTARFLRQGADPGGGIFTSIGT
jgi:hypothetical protein